MFFRNKKLPDSRRARQPDASGGLGAKPVFSYHTQSARSESTGRKRAIRLPWANNTKPPSPRRDSRRIPRRVLVVSLAVLAVVLLANVLFLSRDPAIVVHEQSDGRQLLLRSEEIYRDAARAVLTSSLTSTNKLTINTDGVAQEVQKQFPELAHVSVVLPVIGRQPIIHIQTARPALILTSGQAGSVYLIDEFGRVVMDASKVAVSVKQDLPVVQDQSGLLLAVGDGALPQDDVLFITEVVGQLAAKSIRVSSMVLPASASELDVRVEGAPYMVKFNLRGYARVGVGAFLAVKQHLEREGKTPSSYVDVRVDNKAYYR